MIPWRKIKSKIEMTGNRYIVAVSGGIDSMFALDFLKSCNVEIIAAHFNHRMRETAIRDQNFVLDYCIKNDIDISVSQGKNIKNEEDARIQRYNFLETLRKQTKSDYIITGHHFNDQIETILMRLTRGIPLDNLKMQEITVSTYPIEFKVFRPFLNVPKEIIQQKCMQRKISWVEDESNQSNDYERNRFRNIIIPEMMKNRDIIKSMIKTWKV